MSTTTSNNKHPITVINIDSLYESKTISEAKKNMSEGIFSHLITALVSFWLGKKTGVKIQGKPENVERFEKALKKINQMIDKDIVGASPDQLKNIAAKYNVKLVQS